MSGSTCCGFGVLAYAPPTGIAWSMNGAKAAYERLRSARTVRRSWDDSKRRGHAERPVAAARGRGPREVRENVVGRHGAMLHEPMGLQLGGGRGQRPAIRAPWQLSQRRGDERLHLGSLGASRDRSEEHTSELQSRLHLVCRLLLEKKKTKQKAPERL